jgi:hypothetical protein
VFKKLNMPKGIKLETLTVGHFLDAVPALVANTQVRNLPYNPGIWYKTCCYMKLAISTRLWLILTALEVLHR